MMVMKAQNTAADLRRSKILFPSFPGRIAPGILNFIKGLRPLPYSSVDKFALLTGHKSFLQRGEGRLGILMHLGSEIYSHGPVPSPTTVQPVPGIWASVTKLDGVCVVG